MESTRKCLPIIIILMMLSGCTSQSTFDDADDSSSKTALTIWSTYEVDSLEEQLFIDSVSEWSNARGIEVEVVNKPFFEAVQAYKVAALGGEAPDLMRFSNDQLGSIAPIRDRGEPLLEDLRPWLTPENRSGWDPLALESMRFENSLLALPVSQDCVSLLYNRAMFDTAGIAYPDESWKLSDLLAAAEELTSGDQVGIALPLKDPYRWFAVNSGFGGELFNEDGGVNLSSSESAAALDWWLDMELEHGIVPTGVNVETMKEQFKTGRAAMVIDGPWNWPTYSRSRLDVGQSLLPIVEESGERMSPMIGYKGWAISKQSQHKQEAFSLAMYLSSHAVQRDAALQTMTMPVSMTSYSDEAIQSDPVLSGFILQASHGFPAPTSKVMSEIYEVLPSAIENVYVGKMTSEEALAEAQSALMEVDS